MKHRAGAAAALALAALLPLLGVAGLRGQASTQKDIAALEKLNVEIAAAEDRGDRKWLEGVLASHLSFRRALGTVVDRKDFLKEVKAGRKSETRVESVTLYGKERAVVTCIVTIKGARDRSYHNVRLFVREGGKWKVIGWANEEL